MGATLVGTILEVTIPVGAILVDAILVDTTQ